MPVTAEQRRRQRDEGAEVDQAQKGAVDTLEPDEVEAGESFETFDTVTQPVKTLELPVVDARVVYLGSNRYRTVALRGCIQARDEDVLDDTVPGGIRKKRVESVVLDGSTHNYDFTSHDATGRLRVTDMMPDTAKPHLRRRPFAVCKHPVHLWEFSRMRRDGQPEFEVIAGKDRGLLATFFAEQDRLARARDLKFEDVLKAQ